MSGQSAPRLVAATGAFDTSHPAPVRRVRLDVLMAGDREVIIEHRGDDYRLRITSNGKLLLTK